MCHVTPSVAAYSGFFLGMQHLLGWTLGAPRAPRWMTWRSSRMSSRVSRGGATCHGTPLSELGHRSGPCLGCFWVARPSRWGPTTWLSLLLH